MSEVLLPYGYDYLQIDDGYQRGTGLPELWLKPNEKFPAGWQATGGLHPAARASSRASGPTPPSRRRSTRGSTRSGSSAIRPATSARGNWIDHPVDATAPGALDTLVRPIYRELRGHGLGVLQARRAAPPALRGLQLATGLTSRGRALHPGDALRQYVAAVREEIGRDRFLLACWGVRPELVGLVDGCRIGTDGFSYAGLAQYNSFNNVVWRNDPDHIELSETEAWRSTMVTSLTGSLFLLTDKPERYRTAFVEPARRAAPVLVTVPGQLYDVDPSRSSELRRVDAEVSGRDPKPFDAGLTPSVHPLPAGGEPAVRVVGGAGPHRRRASSEIRCEELGLDPAEALPRVRVLAAAGSSRAFAESFAPGDLPQPFNSQVFVIREELPRPQFLSLRAVTSRAAAWTSGRSRGRTTC